MYPEPSTAQKMMISAQKGSEKRLKSVRKEEKRALGINTPGLTVKYGFGEVGGTTVTEEGALGIIAVYACVSYIADYVASLPKIVYRRLNKGKDRATEHYLYPILHDEPNPYQNDYEFVETLTGHVLLWGNAYAEVQRNGSGKVQYLWPLRPDKMRLVWLTDRRKLVYFYTFPNMAETALREVLHLRGLNSDGIVGYSPVQLASTALGVSKAEEDYRANFFTNNASPGGYLEHPGRLSKEASDNLRRGWEDAHRGVTNSHRVAVLEEGLKWHQIGLPAKDIEFIDGRRYQKTEIASLFRVKPYKIGILEPGTVSYASVEQQAIDNHVDTMRPWIIKWEKKFNALFTQTERKNYFMEFLMEGVLRGDTESRYRGYQIARQNGWMSANDIREVENQNPISVDDGGDDYWRPSNYVVAGAEEQLALPLANGSAAKPMTNGAAH